MEFEEGCLPATMYITYMSLKQSSTPQQWVIHVTQDILSATSREHRSIFTSASPSVYTRMYMER